MAKPSTNRTQQRLIEIGMQLGFVAKAEYTFPLGKNFYEPRYDVVWFLDITSLDFSRAIANLLGESVPTIFQTDLIPFAAFEVEGSTTSSKNQVGNVQNLKICPAYLKFLVVDNGNATTENDTYRRALKIIKSVRLSTGDANLFLMDACHIVDDINFSKTIIQHESMGKRALTKGSGGEKKAEKYRDKFLQSFIESRVDIYYDYTPAEHKWRYSVDKKFQYIKSTAKDNVLLKQQVIWEPKNKIERKVTGVGRLYYQPKIDICVGFKLTAGFLEFLTSIGESLGKDIIHFPLLHYQVENPMEPFIFPLLGIEIESQSSKHALGGIANLSNYFLHGIILGPVDLKRYVQTMARFSGLQNITFLNEEELG